MADYELPLRALMTLAALEAAGRAVRRRTTRRVASVAGCPTSPTSGARCCP